MQHTTQPHLHPVSTGTHPALVVAIACAMPFVAVQVTHAQAAPIVVDPSAANRPTLADAPNGTPIVNITAPDSAGISHNRFTEYNVNPTGLVLNNSASAVDTRLAGRIDGNAQLGGAPAPASVILNQVTGVNASMLVGATEVAGQNARIIVANPNGISVNGGTFINANRVSLVAGTPEFNDNGTIQQFRTENGRISIDGTGLDAGNVDQLDLISRTLKVNAAVQARRVTAVAQRGVADIEDVQSGNYQLASQARGPLPDVAIDVSKLGSMHASSIMMYGTAAGVGVNLAGKVDAVTGAISISSNGHSVQLAPRPEVTPPVVVKPVEPKPPVVVAERPAQPEVTPPAVSKPVAPSTQTVALWPMMPVVAPAFLPPLPFVPFRPAGVPSFAFSPVPAPMFTPFGMMPVQSMFTRPPVLNLGYFRGF
ncbi:filamentous hemagglutinin N-terminal domain-containing protein [Burkholderia contaminans]|uniref:filamentous hemagglutinin N-terminal domain-containing protein n=1 Tax=Burkholderia contaminans TaxID=488447 RepID=UPI0014531FD9|nr:filamentous hemagglutinin N-terminal domain-containing protein [Burkholderia contaminans]VWD47558.1 filamentous hemagglutinin [Burkholderia contaminans]